MSVLYCAVIVSVHSILSLLLVVVGIVVVVAVLLLLLDGVICGDTQCEEALMHKHNAAVCFTCRLLWRS